MAPSRGVAWTWFSHTAGTGTSAVFSSSSTGSAEPFVAAVALVRALRAGVETAEGGDGVSEAINRALDLLAAGLADYTTATRAPTPSSPRNAPQDRS
jgi:hypothetical protein